MARLVTSPQARARSFGITFGALGAALAGWLFWKQAPTAPFVMAAATLLLGAAFLRPAVLQVPSDLWWRLATALGWLNSRVLLLAMFFLVLTPVGRVRRLLGIDTLRLTRRGPAWTPYPARYRDKKHYERLF